MDIACASDARYLRHCAVMIRSLISEHRDRDLRVHVLLAPDVKPSQLARLKRMADGTRTSIIEHWTVPAALAELPSWGRISNTMWGRILLPELLPHTERVLYVDVDVLVVAALEELWSIDLSNVYLAAVTNVPERHRFSHAAELGLPASQGYFNSGVLLLNLEMMRRDGAAEAIRDCVRIRGSDLLWPDQDAFNIVLGDRRLPLHPRFNLMNSIRKFSWSEEFLDPREVSAAIANPAIVHFEGPDENKPWHLLSEHPHRGTYLRYRRESPWPRLRPSGITPRNLFRLATRPRPAGLRP